MVAPAGTLVPKLKVRVLTGRSSSVAWLVTVTVAPACTIRLLNAIKTGGRLLSSTVMVTRFVVLSGGMLLSVTRTPNELVAGPCHSKGVQLKRPVTGWIVALV